MNNKQSIKVSYERRSPIVSAACAWIVCVSRVYHLSTIPFQILESSACKTTVRKKEERINKSLSDTEGMICLQ